MLHHLSSHEHTLRSRVLESLEFLESVLAKNHFPDFAIIYAVDIQHFRRCYLFIHFVIVVLDTCFRFQQYTTYDHFTVRIEFKRVGR